MTGETGLDLMEDKSFRLVIDLGDQVDDTLVLDFVLEGIPGMQDGSSLAGQIFKIG
jgi:hypothetical protein